MEIIQILEVDELSHVQPDQAAFSETVFFPHPDKLLMISQVVEKEATISKRELLTLVICYMHINAVPVRHNANQKY